MFLLTVSSCSGGPDAEPEASFVGSAACGECHPEAYSAWQGSHHDRAMQIADTSSVLGDFEGSSFRHRDEVFEFFRNKDRYYVRATGVDGTVRDHEIAYTFGVAPLQQYLVVFPEGRLQALSIAWDTRPADRGGQRWFHLTPDEDASPGDPLHWTGRYYNWNAMCASCHSTDLRKRYDAAADGYDTTWAEVNVGCEACHGPGDNHARERGGPLPVDLAGGRAEEQLEVCASCHSRRSPLTEHAPIGARFLDHFAPTLLREGLYHADGSIQEEVYVYGSFVQSRMHAAGVRCGDCHDPHSLGLVAEGNGLCARCHSQTPDTRFPQLVAKEYDAASHHFHPEDSAGAECVSCHMPATTYMRIDPRRDHGLRVPRPDRSARVGASDPCEGCHADRAPGWAAARVQDWYGPESAAQASWPEALAAGRARASHAEGDLVAAIANPETPPIARASALALLVPRSPEARHAIDEGVRDPSPHVRRAAVMAGERLPNGAGIALISPLLADPVRAVRIEAARALVPHTDGLPPESARQQRAALAEYESAQRANADLPWAHLNLGVVADGSGEPLAAEQAYLRALRLDPDFLPARANLAMVYNRADRNAEAEAVLREGLERRADEGELHYSLGLLLAEEGRLQEAEPHLDRAAQLLPRHSRARYNHALTLQHQGRLKPALAELRLAHDAAPDDADIIHALAIAHLQRGDPRSARPYVVRLVKLLPNAPGPRAMLDQIDAALESTLSTEE